MNNFKFDFGDKVKGKVSGLEYIVIGKSEIYNKSKFLRVQKIGSINEEPYDSESYPEESFDLINKKFIEF